MQDIPRVRISTIAAKFHNTLARAILAAIEDISLQTGIKVIAFSGGCFQNRTLLGNLLQFWPEKYKLLVHIHVPANDGGISLGQAVIANHQLSNIKE